MVIIHCWIWTNDTHEIIILHRFSDLFYSLLLLLIYYYYYENRTQGTYKSDSTQKPSKLILLYYFEQSLIADTIVQSESLSIACLQISKVKRGISSCAKRRPDNEHCI